MLQFKQQNYNNSTGEPAMTVRTEPYLTIEAPEQRTRIEAALAALPRIEDGFLPPEYFATKTTFENFLKALLVQATLGTWQYTRTVVGNSAGDQLTPSQVKHHGQLSRMCQTIDSILRKQNHETIGKDMIFFFYSGRC